MNILIFGATGSTGRCLVVEALAREHAVSAFVRDPARLPVQHAGLRVISGDVMNADSVEAAITGHDAVLCALGVLPGARADASRSQRGVPVCSVGTRNILSGMAKHGVKRLVVQSAASVGESRHTGRFGAGWIVRTVMRDIMEDKERQDALLKASTADWTLVRPVKLVERAATGQINSGEELSWSLASKVSFADVAVFMVAAIDMNGTVRKAITIRG